MQGLLDQEERIARGELACFDACTAGGKPSCPHRRNTPISRRVRERTSPFLERQVNDRCEADAQRALEGLRLDVAGREERLPEVAGSAAVPGKVML